MLKWLVRAATKGRLKEERCLLLLKIVVVGDGQSIQAEVSQGDSYLYHCFTTKSLSTSSADPLRWIEAKERQR
jgi:hypothetical protein